MNAESWIAFPRDIEEQTGVIAVDLTYVDPEERGDRPWSIALRFDILEPDEDGQPSEEESERLDAIGEAIVEALNERSAGLFVAMRTHGGYRYIYTQCGEPDPAKEAIVAAMAQFSDQAWGIAVEEEPDWITYQQLCPDEFELQWVADAQLVRYMDEQGDDVAIPRSVNHWAYFPTEIDRDAFAAAAKSQGFAAVENVDADECEDEGEDHEHGDSCQHEGMPCGVRLTRKHAVDFDTVYPITCGLIELANQHEGQYDGWETEIVGK